jgi:hypothetical protein
MVRIPARAVSARIVLVALAVVATASLTACRRKEAPQPPVATPSLTLNHDRAPIGSPLELTYKFVVANDARFDHDYRVMLHVLDTDDQLIWTDDHNPPVPTTQWKPGQTVEYTRTLFIPIYPYIGEVSLQMGLYSTATQKRLPLAGEDTGQRAYRVGRLQLRPQTENLFTVFKDGFHPTEVADRNATVGWQWTKKQATIAFKNPKKDSFCYLDVDNPGVFKESQQVQVSIGGQTLDEFQVKPQEQVLRKFPIKANQLGNVELAELKITVDKTFVPARLLPGASNDPRELGVRVFHAIVEPKR